MTHIFLDLVVVRDTSVVSGRNCCGAQINRHTHGVSNANYLFYLVSCRQQCHVASKAARWLQDKRARFRFLFKFFGTFLGCYYVIVTACRWIKKFFPQHREARSMEVSDRDLQLRNKIAPSAEENYSNMTLGHTVHFINLLWRIFLDSPAEFMAANKRKGVNFSVNRNSCAYEQLRPSPVPKQPENWRKICKALKTWFLKSRRVMLRPELLISRANK